MKWYRLPYIAILVLCINAQSFAQDILSKNISLDVNRQRLDQVLEILSNKGDFYFSYNSAIVKKDSLVSFSVRNKSVKEILRLLFNDTYEFQESGNYIIIRKAPIRMTVVTHKATEENRVYSVTGFVYDEQSGAAINDASVYEKALLASALTNDDGYFKLKLKGKGNKLNTATLTVSKEFYEDTSIVIEPRHNQELSITMTPIERETDRIIITPEDYLAVDSPAIDKSPDTIADIISPVRTETMKVEKTGVGKFLLSAKQKVQSVNLSKFFTERPFQLSVTPGLSTHGKMSGQVVNNFSLNLFGGYTGGTNGVELGGLFNIDKKEVKYFQAAGIFNIVGGRVSGVQLAGIHNSVLDTVKGFQAAGISNTVKGRFTGMQVGGIYNHVSDSVQGLQTAGIANFARRKLSGVQIGGVANFSNKETNGVQIAGVFNYSKKLKGLQIGLINVADTSSGVSIGLINIIVKGYHKLSFSTNEAVDLTAALKTGNSKLYSILMAGLNVQSTERLYSFGFGLGSELALNKRKTLSLNPELSSQYLYAGSWDFTNILNKLHMNLTVKLGKYVSLFAGPSFAVFVSDQKVGFKDYTFPIPPSGYKTIFFSDKVKGWFGWNVGINLF